MVRGFELGANVTENVRALRKALGSVTTELSFAKFATVLVQHGARATLNATTVYDWTKGTEPDIASIAIMANLSGVTFEQFALGRPREPTGEEIDALAELGGVDLVIPLVTENVTGKPSKRQKSG